MFFHGVDAKLLLLDEADSLFLQVLLSLIAGLFREQVFGTGVECAKSASTAQLGPLVPVGGAGQGEAQASHDFMRHDLVAEKVSRAKLCAIATLVTCGFSDVIDANEIFEALREHVRRRIGE